MGREEHCMCGECSQCFSRTRFAPALSVCAFPVYTSQALGHSAKNCLRQALGCMHFPAVQVQVLRYSTKGQTFLGLSSSGDQVLGERSHPPGVGFILSLPPSQLLGFLGIQRAHLLRCAVCLFWGADPCLQHCRWIPTIQNPKKSWLAIKPACSLVEDASLGPRLPSSSSGCPCLPVLGGGWASLQPASSAQSFVL